MFIAEVRIKFMEANKVNERRQGEEFLAEELAQVQPALAGMLRARGHNREDIEDIIQDALIKVLKASKKGEIRSPQAYLCRVVLNVGDTLLRKAMQRRKKLGKEVSLDPAHLVFDAFAEHDKEALCEAIPNAVRKLPRDLKEIVTLRLGGQPFTKIGDTVGLPEWTARRKFNQALAHLRFLLETRDQK